MPLGYSKRQTVTKSTATTTTIITTTTTTAAIAIETIALADHKP